MNRLLYILTAMALTISAAHAQGRSGAALPTRPYDQLSAGELKASGLPTTLSPALAAALTSPRATPDKAVLTPSHLPVSIRTGPLQAASAVSGQTLSTNWSGQLLSGGGQPESTSTVVAAPPPPPNPHFPLVTVTAYYCSWVGLDGFGSSDLPLWQIGYCVSSGDDLGPTQVQTFLECYPSDPSIITLFAPSIGDSIYYTVWNIGPGMSAGYVQDQNTGQYFFINNDTCNPPLATSETIVEDPTTSTNVLADYGTLSVSTADNIATGVGFGDPTATQIIMINIAQSPNSEISVPTPTGENSITFNYYPPGTIPLPNQPPPPPCTVCQPPPSPVPPSQPKPPRQPRSPVPPR